MQSSNAKAPVVALTQPLFTALAQGAPAKTDP
jgi:hypothetical protein